jgi:hypothetical protein
MLGRFIETSLVVSANRSGLGNLIVLRANASTLRPDVLLTDDFVAQLIARFDGDKSPDDKLEVHREGGWSESESWYGGGLELAEEKTWEAKETCHQAEG